ncbi:MAG TPA: membrane protein insertion efficiency factor YidD [Clostridiales bacterium]|nr:membrane protein insertion efficiency factor YidD [Clostridiales bacterium]
MKYLIIFFIKLYQIVISPISPGKCRFTPSCSNYTIEAIRKYGSIRGIIMGIKRIMRCNPFNPGGYDPVP